MTDPKYKEILQEVITYFEDPAHWTKKACARDANGESVLSDSPSAVSHCTLGAFYTKSAVVHSCSHAAKLHAHGLSNKLASFVGDTVSHWNDTRTHAELIGTLKEFSHQLD